MQDSPPQASEPSQSSQTPIHTHQLTKKPPTAKKQFPQAMCRVCKAQKNIRKDTVWICEACPEKPGLCSPACFDIWHTEQDRLIPTPPRRKQRRRRASRQPVPGTSAASADLEAPSPEVVEPVSSHSVVEPVSSAAKAGGSGIVSGRFYSATAKMLPDGSYALPPSSSGSSYSASDSSS